MPYVPPKYPGEIPTVEDLPDRVDNVDWFYAARYNELKKELRAALIELGIDPSGDYDTVKARLDAIPSIPQGVIVMWSGLLANIPDGWALCDGGDGRPNLRDKFVKGAADGVNPGGTGGSKTHNHIVDNHGHPVNLTSGNPSYYVDVCQDNVVEYAAGEYHNHPVTGNTGGAAPGTDSKNHEPEYYEVAYIIKT